jgi:hypothetical protein
MTQRTGSITSDPDCATTVGGREEQSQGGHLRLRHAHLSSMLDSVTLRALGPGQAV